MHGKPQTYSSSVYTYNFTTDVEVMYENEKAFSKRHPRGPFDRVATQRDTRRATKNADACWVLRVPRLVSSQEK